MKKFHNSLNLNKNFLKLFFFSENSLKHRRLNEEACNENF